MKVLLLGGTSEARELADGLMQVGDLDVVTSVAGRTATTRGLPGATAGARSASVRRGGFGGAEGLVSWLRANQVDAVLDATHPFAATMTSHAAEATDDLGLPFLVLRRPAWTETPGDRWYRVSSAAEAAAWLTAWAKQSGGVRPTGQRVLLTIGRQGLDAFASCGLPIVARCIEPPDPRPTWCDLILDRGPYELAAERELLRSFAILVTKDSGGPMTSAKLTAARELSLPVLMVQRPPLPPGVTSVGTVADALAWIRHLTTSHHSRG